MLVLWTLIISQNVTDSATPTCAVAIGDEADPGSGVLATICDDNGLDVLAALQRAQEVSPLSRDAALAVEQFRSDRRAARAAMLPRIQLTAGYTRISDVENPPLFPPQSAETQGANAADIGQLSDPAAQRLWNRDIEQASAESSASFPVIQDNWTIEQSLDWSLLDFVLSNRKRYRAAGLRLNARELEEAAARRSVRFNATQAYYNLVVAKGRERIAAESVRRSEAVEKEVRALVLGGSTLRSELLRVESQTARFRGDLIEAEADRASAARSLQTLLDLPESDDVALRFALPELDSVAPFESAWRTAQENREEIAALQALAKASEREADSLEFEQLPDLVLTGQNRRARPNPRILPPVDEFRSDWSIGLALTWSPTGFLETRHRTASARAQEQRAELAVESFRDTVRDRVAQTHARARASLAVTASAKIELLSAREAYRVRRVQYPAGLTTLSDLIDTEAELTEAQLRLLNATVRSIIDRAALYREIGRDYDFLQGV